MSQTLPRPMQFRLVHHLVATFLAAAWLALFRFGRRAQLGLVVGTAVMIGPVIAAMGRASFRPWIELTGNLLTILSPFIAMGGMYLCWRLASMGH